METFLSEIDICFGKIDQCFQRGYLFFAKIKKCLNFEILKKYLV